MERKSVPKLQTDGRKVFSNDEADLYELCGLAGLSIDPCVFKIIVELLHMNVTPVAVEKMLSSMASLQKKS